jgi:hypothetical protein
MGGIAEYQMRQREQLSPYYAPQVIASTPATVLTTTPIITQTVQQQPQQVTVINNYPGTASSSAMSSANALFGR